MAIILLIKTEDGQVTELPLLNKVIMGRSGNSDYKIADIKMSGTHCSFEITNKNQIMFTDMGSTNGSFINNAQVMQTLFRINDVIRIGNTLIKLEEKRLSSSERLAIGSTLVNKKNDKTLPDMSKIKEPAPPPPPGGEVKKKTIVLSKEHKEKKKVASNWGGSENVIDQEASSGQTKFLKLNKKTTKK